MADANLRVGNFAGLGANVFDPATGNPVGSNRQLFPNSQIPGNRFDPAAVKLTSLIPAPNIPGVTNTNYFASGVYEFDRTNWDLKVNYNPNDKAPRRPSLNQNFGNLPLA